MKMNEDVELRTIIELASTLEECQQLIQDTGYLFTTDEWQTAMKEIQTDVFNQELKEEELEAIAVIKAKIALDIAEVSNLISFLERSR
ncbi:MAG: hypothetical protein RLZZ381_657 [Cyanobacteriota bacterium]|jgi:predicted ribosomally synthesized peptide with nif11-like leader